MSLQVIPQISSLTWVTTVIPLALVITLTAIKDIADDYVSMVTLRLRIFPTVRVGCQFLQRQTPTIDNASRPVRLVCEG